MDIVSVVQGEYAVTKRADVSMTTVLGSCIAACIYDPDARIGGMNHFLLPEPLSGASSNVKYGAFLMELLLNELLKSGAHRPRLCAKLYGGSNMNAAIGNVGERNIDFVQRYLKNEAIPVKAHDLGGHDSRRVTFHPASGEVTLKTASGDTPREDFSMRSRRIRSSEVELF